MKLNLNIISAPTWLCIILIVTSYTIASSLSIERRSRSTDSKTPLLLIFGFHDDHEDLSDFDVIWRQPLTSLRRSRRNAIATSQQLNVSKQIQVLEVFSNPDTFRVSLTGNTVLPNITVYDVTVTEDTTGLEVRAFNEPNDQSLLSVQTNSVAYPSGNISGSQTLRFSYDATLRNFGSDISSLHNVTTTVQYYTAPQQMGNLESLNLVVCLKKTIRTISACAWCWSILIIFLCIIAGISLPFLLLLFYLCLPNGLPIIQRLRNNKTKDETSSSSKQRSQRLKEEYDVTDIGELLALDNEVQMLTSVEILEFRQLVAMENIINEERIIMTKQSMLSLLSTEERKIDPDEEDDVGLHHCLQLMEAEASEQSAPSTDEQTEEKLYEGSTKRSDELTRWKEKLRGFPQEIQGELMSLVEQCLVHDHADADFIHKLEILLNKKINSFPEEVQTRKCLKHLESSKNSEGKELLYNIAECENLIVENLCKIFAKNIHIVTEISESRKKKIKKRNHELMMERNVRDKMVEQIFNVIEKAERRNHISLDESNKLKQDMTSFEKKLNDKHEEEIYRCRVNIKTSINNSKRRPRRSKPVSKFEAMKDHGDVKEWIKTTTISLEKQLQKEIEDEKQLDAVAFDIFESILTKMSELRKSVKRERERMQESLMQLGVDEEWIDDLLQSQREELGRFCDEIDDVDATPHDSSSYDVTNTDDAALQLLRLVNSSQPMTSQTHSLSVVRSEILLKNNLLNSWVSQRLEGRLQDHIRFVAKKKKVVDDLTEGDDVDEMRCKLEEKISLGSRGDTKKTKKSKLRNKRHQSIRLYNEVKTTLSSMLSHHYQRCCDQCSLERERKAMEEISITLLELMTSSGKVTSRECRVILEEFKLEAEETKRKYAIERKRREDHLKKKTERRLTKKQNDLKRLGNDSHVADSLTSLLHVKEDAIDASSTLIDDERSTIQELFQTVNDVFIDQERALLAQELLFIRKLSTALRVGFAEIKFVIELLLPGKPNHYVIKLCNVICTGEKPKGKSQKAGFLLEAIRRNRKTSEEMLLSDQHSRPSRQMSRSRKLAPLGGSVRYPGERPDPIGRSSSSEKIDRYDVRLVSTAGMT